MRWPHRSLSLVRTLFFGCVLAAIFAFTCAPAGAQTVPQLPSQWNEAVQALAGKIVDRAGRTKTISLEVKNLSPLSATDVSSIRQSLEAELARRAFHLAPESSAETHVTVTLSEGVDGYIWVAQVRSGDENQKAFVSFSKDANAEIHQTKPAMSLERKLVWTQREQILDFAIPEITSNGIPHMIVLEPRHIVSYDFKEGQWTRLLEIPLHSKVWLPRDTRGIVAQWRGDIEALLPGESCSGMNISVLELKCASELSGGSDDQWPLMTGGTERGEATFQTSRNYFEGSSAVYGVAEAELPDFYNAAVLNSQNGFHWLITDLRGKARLYDSSPRLTATFSGWGDDIAAVATGCDGAWQVLVTGTDDWTQPDHIQIYEVRDRSQLQGSQAQTLKADAIAVGQPLDFPGPILALWPSTDLKSARVVLRNLQTGMYEASIVSVSCSE
jgi:hypothetical protein